MSDIHTIHTCSYSCGRPACIKAQRDELRDRFQVMQPQAQAGDGVNQQLLGDIINMMIAAKGAIKLGRDLDATNYISAAIAAAQGQSQ